MIGTWSPNELDILFAVIRFISIFIVLYFLAILIYWYNRTGRIPSLKTIVRMMLQLAKWFPKIAVHRVKILPARIRKRKTDAYPLLSSHKKNRSRLSFSTHHTMRKKYSRKRRK